MICSSTIVQYVARRILSLSIHMIMISIKRVVSKCRHTYHHHLHHPWLWVDGRLNARIIRWTHTHLNINIDDYVAAVSVAVATKYISILSYTIHFLPIIDTLKDFSNIQRQRFIVCMHLLSRLGGWEYKVEKLQRTDEIYSYTWEQIKFSRILRAKSIA